MPTVLLRCLRQPAAPLPPDWVARLTSEFTPHNASERKPIHTEADDLSLTVFHPRSSTLVRGTNCLTGYLYSAPPRWDAVGSSAPTGDFALFRADKDLIEIETDATGSQPLWYTYSKHFFYASTSQRAIVMLLQKFSMQTEQMSSFVSNGHCFPDAGWDDRIYRLPPRSVLRLDRRTWRLTAKQQPAPFTVKHDWTDEKAKSVVKTVIQDVFAAIPASSDQVLSLSGGIDSRLMLHLLNKKIAQTVTWYSAGRETLPEGDAALATQVAEQYNIPHQSVQLAEPDNWTEVIDHFVRYSDGMIDQMSGYFDDFALWQQLESSGIKTMFRGDQMFGCTSVHNRYEVRMNALFFYINDYLGLQARLFGLPELQLPVYMKQHWGESLATWRDRNYRNYYQTSLLSVLNPLKTSWLDVAAPLQHPDIIDVTRQLPDHLRSNKTLLRQIAADWLPPGIPEAKRTATLSAQPVAKLAGLKQAAAAELNTKAAADTLPQKLLQYARHEKPLPTVRQRRGQQKELMDQDLLTMRCMLLSKINTMYQRDARLLRG